MRRALLALALVCATSSVASAQISKIIFMNRCPGDCQVFASNRDNALSDESRIPTIQGVLPGTSMTLAEWRWGDAVWDELLACVQETYRPYDVTVTDVDPGEDVFHHEIKVAGRGTDLGYTAGNSPGGVAAGGAGCDPADNALSFVFANATNSIPYLCAAVAQESGHSFGLPDHILDCTDPMTYLALGGQCGPKYFRNKLMPCGEDSETSCRCGGSRVNPHVQLVSVFGLGEPLPGPATSITTPADGGTISDTTGVLLSASDVRGIARIEILFNGWLWGEYDAPESITPPFTWPTSHFVNPTDGFPDGVIEIEARAYTDLGSMGSDTITVTKGAPCTSADTCLDGQRCDAGKCLWDAPEGQLGDACTYDQFCEGPNTYDGMCAADGELAICSHTCFAGPNDNCEDGYACRPDDGSSGAGVCFPATSGDPTCLDCSGGSGGAGGLLLLGALVGGLTLRRRRR